MCYWQIYLFREKQNFQLTEELEHAKQEISEANKRVQQINIELQAKHHTIAALQVNIDSEIFVKVLIILQVT